MGTTSRDLALGLREDWHLGTVVGDDELARLCAVVGLEVELAELPCGREVVVDRRVVIEARLCRAWRRWLTAHGMGHVLLHAGDQFRMDHTGRAKQERQADDFAGWLLCGGVYRACACAGDPEPLWRLAEEAEVPPACAAAWVLSARLDLCRSCRRGGLAEAGG